MELYTKRENVGGLDTYVHRLEPFLLMPRAHLKTLREREPIMSIRPLAILKAEVCGLFDLVDQLGVERVSMVLRPVYEAMVTTVHGRGGEIIELQLDRFTAVWGFKGTEFASVAALTAIEMRESLKQYQDQSPILHTLGLKIGLDQGRVAEMVIGPSTRQAYSVIGPAVLQANRLMETASAGDIKVGKIVFDETSSIIVYEPCYVESDLVKGEAQSYLALRARS